MFKFLAPAIAIISFSIAQADQCQYVDQATAERAFAVVEQANKIHALCEPCGETKAQEVSYTAITIKPLGYENFWGIYLDRSNIDLAYTFVDGVNLADLAQCPAEGVSHRLPQ